MPARKPDAPADWQDADVYALQALGNGKANEDQQRRALKWIVESACGAYAETFVGDKPDVSAYLAGRRSVGRQIVNLLTLNMARVKDAQAQIEKRKTARKRTVK